MPAPAVFVLFLALLLQHHGCALAVDCAFGREAVSVNVTMLVEGSASISAGEFDTAIALTVAVMAALPADARVSLLEYSAFPCAAVTQCTPFVMGADALEDAAASVDRSFGALARPALAVDYALAHRASANQMLIVAGSSPDDAVALRDAVGRMQAAGVRVLVLAVGESVAQAYTNASLGVNVVALTDYAQLAAPNLATSVAATLACPGALLVSGVDGGRVQPLVLEFGKV